MTQRDRHHFVGRGHLQIKGQVGRFHDPGNIRVTDMPPVFPQMRRNSIGTDTRDDFSCANRIGMIATARVPDCRDMVDIYAEPQRGNAGHRLIFSGCPA